MESNDVFIVSENELIKKVRERIIGIMTDRKLSFSDLGDLCHKDRQTIENALCPIKNNRHSDVFIAQLCHGLNMTLSEFYNFEIPLCANPNRKVLK